MQAKNATFLFKRDFIEYHGDRFEDYSLMVFKKEKLVAILPANRTKNNLYSHQGLTYGGLVLENEISSLKVFEIFDTILEFLKSKGFKKIYIKQIPSFYSKLPSFEIDYILSKKKALVNKEMVFAINYSQALNIHKTKIKHFRKGHEYQFKIKEDDVLDVFWDEILEPRLLENHNAKPVHTLGEINYLKQIFPKNIQQFSIYLEDKILAGITLFDMGSVVKSQYGATSKLGEKYRALDYLFLYLIKKFKEEGKQYFSMGTVAEKNEVGFNPGLLKQKEELGARLYVQEFYSLELK